MRGKLKFFSAVGSISGMTIISPVMSEMGAESVVHPFGLVFAGGALKKL